MKNEIKRAKIFNYTIAIIFLTIFVSAVIVLGVWKWSRTFTVSKWMDNPNERYKIVSNMISRYEIVGMTEQEIIALLGEEDENAPESFDYPREDFPNKSTLTYYLGVDFMEYCWLIIPLENGIAVECHTGYRS